MSRFNRRPVGGDLVGRVFWCLGYLTNKVFGLTVARIGFGQGAASQQREGHHEGFEEEEESHLPGAGLNCVGGNEG